MNTPELPEIHAQLHEQANTIIDTAAQRVGVPLAPLSPLRLTLRREIADALYAEWEARQQAEQRAAAAEQRLAELTAAGQSRFAKASAKHDAFVDEIQERIRRARLD